ncbi:MAG: hypothetical protein M5U23_05405 [Acidimicrobiia bacterium]|nr:hypothetical protein [Acidimicrobiia bacterium]
MPVTSPNDATWALLGNLYEDFPSGWLLIGGLMVYLHGAESGQTMRRVTTDADILIRVKVIHDGTRQVATWLQERGLEFEGASAMEIGHRFSGGGISVDVLVQGHLGVRAERRTVGQNRAPEAPGGTALQAAGEVVPIITSTGGLVRVPRPTLPAAIIGKSKAAIRLSSPLRHVQDLAFLLGLLVDPLTVADGLTASDVRILARAVKQIEEAHCWEYAADAAAAEAAAQILLAPRQ